MSNDILNLISKIGEKEASLKDKVFISPVFFNTSVAARVSGLIYTFEIPKLNPGWYAFKPTGTSKARKVKEATMAEIEAYVKPLPKIRAVLTMKKDDVYLAKVDKVNRYLPTEELHPVLLCDDSVSDFDQVICRFDGANLWYESLDAFNGPAKGEYLREQMLKLTDPDKVRFSGLLFEERSAYALRLALDKKLVEDRKKLVVEADVKHAGGKLIKFVERSDHLSVTYTVDGQQYTSYVSKDPKHQVITAGVCLSGNDQKFDLKSLVTVLREGHRRHAIHHFNNTNDSDETVAGSFEADPHRRTGDGDDDYEDD